MKAVIALLLMAMIGEASIPRREVLLQASPFDTPATRYLMSVERGRRIHEYLKVHPKVALSQRDIEDLLSFYYQ